MRKVIADSMKAVNAGVVEVGAVADNALVEAVVSTENEPASVEEPKKSRLQWFMRKRHFQALQSAF